MSFFSLLLLLLLLQFNHTMNYSVNEDTQAGAHVDHNINDILGLGLQNQTFFLVRSFDME